MKKGFIMLVCILLQACASSDVSREAEGSVNDVYTNISESISNIGSGNLGDAYQNTSQTTKGVVLGGTTGALAGNLSGVGTVPGAALGAVFGGAFGAYIDSHTSPIDQLENRGVKVIVLGDQMMLVLPSAHVFKGMTTVLQPEIYSTLDKISQFISGYPNMSVKVAAYVTMAGPERINRQLSQQQANAIVKYLWRTGINTRLLCAVGEGKENPVVKDSLTSIDTYNYRIEITLEKLPV